MESSTSVNVDILKFVTPNKVKMARSEIEHRLDYTLLKILEEDITLGSASGGSVKAHRCVLAGMSPVFRAMFDHEMKEQLSVTVNITNMSINALQLFLLLLYSTNEHDKIATNVLPGRKAVPQLVSAASDEHFNEFYEAVIKYQVAYRLGNLLLRALVRNLAANNCWYFYERSLDIADPHGPKLLVFVRITSWATTMKLLHQKVLQRR